MLHWEKRPIEVANLLNPAFCSILLRDSVETFQIENRQGMSYPLSFLILPLVLHKPTREALPRTTRTKLHTWLQEKPEVRIGFAERARQLVPYSKEAIIFGLQTGIIEVNENGDLIPYSKRLKELSGGDEVEPSICRKKAQFLGRWLAKAGDLPTILIMWGICP